MQSLRVSLKNFKDIRSIKPEILSPEKVQEAMKLYGLSESWEVKQDGKRNILHRKFTFKHFMDSFGFINACAVVADQSDHHPEWFNVYNRVNITLSTHDAGGVTLKDILLAKSFNLIEEEMQLMKPHSVIDNTFVQYPSVLERINSP